MPLPTEVQPNLPYQPQTSLDSLATAFAMQQPQGQNYGPEVPATMGLDVTPPDKKLVMGQYLQNLGMQYKTHQREQQGRQFLKGVHDIMSANLEHGDRVNKLIDLKAQHGTDYGLGLDEIIKNVDIVWKPSTKEEAYDYEDKKNSNQMSPFLEGQKNKRTETLIETIETNKVKSHSVEEALMALDKIDPGVVGKIKRGTLKIFDPDNPLFADWQKVKMVLTDAQLMYTAKTKGAISDREMELFAKAAANDDVALKPAIVPALNKLRRFIDAENRSKVKAYQKLYGEDASSLIIDEPMDKQQYTEDGQQEETIDEETANKFYIQAGGDVDLAREMAREAGYKF